MLEALDTIGARTTETAQPLAKMRRPCTKSSYKSKKVLQHVLSLVCGNAYPFLGEIHGRTDVYLAFLAFRFVDYGFEKTCNATRCPCSSCEVSCQLGPCWGDFWLTDHELDALVSHVIKAFQQECDSWMSCSEGGFPCASTKNKHSLY